MDFAPALRVSGRSVPAERLIRNELLLIGIVVALGAVVPLVLGAVSGATGIPRNDDWSYRRTALELFRTGHLAFDNVAAPMLIGQLVLVQPLLWLTHGSDLAFTIAGSLASSLAVLAAYWMARELLTPTRSFFVALSLVLFPGFLAYSTSFMTDAPALAAQLGAVALGMRAFCGPRTDLRRLGIAMLLAVVGFSIRQFALAAVGALAIAAVAREPKRAGAWAVAVAGVGTCALIALVRAAMPGPLVVLAPDPWFVTRIPQAAVSVGLMLLPAATIAIVTNRRSWRRGDAAYGALLGVALAAPIVARWIRFDAFPDALIGNLTTQQGVLDVFGLGDGRPFLFTDPFWATMNLLGMVGLVVVGAAITATLGAQLRRRPVGPAARLRELGTPPGVVVAFVLVSAAGLVVYGAAWILFDRYLWPIVPALATLLLIPTAANEPDGSAQQSMWGRVLRPATLVPLSVLTLQGLLAFTLMANALAFDVARWHGGEDLARGGVALDAIDAGYEWVGAHATTDANLWHPIPTKPTYRGWWSTFRACALVTGTAEPPADGHLVGIEPYRLYLVAGPVVNLYLYRIDGPGCAGSG